MHADFHALTHVQRCQVSTRQQQHSRFWKPVVSIQLLGRCKSLQWTRSAAKDIPQRSQQVHCHSQAMQWQTMPQSMGWQQQVPSR